ncbi:hypothetical protein J8273_1981 [Carpediemonas membranifera]|uniref:Uncharacterized protein n=1 Tax=Carpediemonas membranifera TaxID=201153 RepID=A0A8J6BGC6_9EUKA|nr:hypothetical protein J8273_1981 [Carpediemonas membranifera]|eukprot:KAG9396927.1 hypothetical protein J8273_1981 [Carpediemonas membranifera]
MEAMSPVERLQQASTMFDSLIGKYQSRYSEIGTPTGPMAPRTRSPPRSRPVPIQTTPPKSPLSSFSLTLPESSLKSHRSNENTLERSNMYLRASLRSPPRKPACPLRRPPSPPPVLDLHGSFPCEVRPPARAPPEVPVDHFDFSQSLRSRSTAAFSVSVGSPTLERSMPMPSPFTPRSADLARSPHLRFKVGAPIQGKPRGTAESGLSTFSLTAVVPPDRPARNPFAPYSAPWK